MLRLQLLCVAALSLSAIGCDDDEMMNGQAGPVTFDVTIENQTEAYEFSSSGAFNTPVGATDPAPIGPGEAYEFSFSAAPGARLTLATMFVQSNDFFYAPSGSGIELFENDGTPVTGDITSSFMLWDSGTEVNQEPGTGADQAPRQSGPDTGAADPDDTVRLASDDFGNLPAVADVISVTLTATSATRFTVTIENVSDASTLSTSGGSVAVPLSPGVFVIHTEDDPLFTAGQPDRGEGLEAIAEDGDPSALAAALETRTGLTVPLAPGVFALHTVDGPFFTAGQADRGEGLEALAEDGVPSPLAASIDGASGIVESGAFDTPDGAGSPAPIGPGQSYSFSVTAEEGQRLSFATMYVQSNDLFYSPPAAGIALFSGGTPVTGDVTAQLELWDAGTEVNEEPGVGPNQAPRQSGPDTGPAENGVVEIVDDGFSYGDVSDVIRVTVTPRN